MTRNHLVCIVLIALAISGCRGWTSTEPPIHPNPNMDTQIKYKAYRESDFFADQRDMRPRVEGTIAHGDLDGLKQPTMTHALMQRGRQRYDIYCAPCHSKVGDGDGLVGRRMPIKPTTFHSDYMRAQPLKHYVDVETNGIRTMPSYKHQVPIQDRWAIAAYIKALQELKL
ncbi:MAG: cytochrome c [Deltaproteobacteria bacterium]|nr:cytochrome c [Deltaproteobacteria bacterium]